MRTKLLSKKDDIEHFKRMLRDVPWHSAKIRQLQEDIEIKEYELTGLARHSIRMTKEQENSLFPLPHYHGGGISLTEKIFEIDQLKEELEDHRRRILECRSIEYLPWEDQRILIRVFLLRENLYDLAEDLGMSRSNLWWIIEKNISKIL